MTAQQVEGVRIQVVEVSSHPRKLAGCTNALRVKILSMHDVAYSFLLTFIAGKESRAYTFVNAEVDDTINLFA